MLKHKLSRSTIDTLAELMGIADKYALADSAMKAPIRLDSAGMILPEEQPESAKELAGPSNSNRN